MTSAGGAGAAAGFRSSFGTSVEFAAGAGFLSCSCCGTDAGTGKVSESSTVSLSSSTFDSVGALAVAATGSGGAAAATGAPEGSSPVPISAKPSTLPRDLSSRPVSLPWLPMDPLEEDRAFVAVVVAFGTLAAATGAAVDVEAMFPKNKKNVKKYRKKNQNKIDSEGAFAPLGKSLAAGCCCRFCWDDCLLSFFVHSGRRIKYICASEKIMVNDVKKNPSSIFSESGEKNARWLSSQEVMSRSCWRPSVHLVTQ